MVISNYNTCVISNYTGDQLKLYKLLFISLCNIYSYRLVLKKGMIKLSEKYRKRKFEYLNIQS